MAKREKSLYVCSTCQLAKPLGLVGNCYYVNCEACMYEKQAKRKENKAAKAKAFREKLDALGKGSIKL